MAGYDHDEHMSNNAVDAYDDGFIPLSKLTKTDLRSRGIDLPIDFVRWLGKEQHLRYVAKHHTSGHYNLTKFYDLDDVGEQIKKLNIDALRDSYKSDQEISVVRVEGKYPIWGGSLRKPRIDDWQKFTGEKRGNWIYLDGGGRKKASSKYLEFSITATQSS